MTDIPSAADLRRWAVRCAAQAKAAKDKEQRERLLKMQQALLDLAKTQDWLDGKKLPT